MTDPAAAGRVHRQQIENEADRLAELIGSASYEHTSEDHTVTVTVGPGNALTGIELAQGARRHSAAELGRVIVETVQAANRALAEQLAGDVLGSIGGTSAAALEMVEGKLPETPTLDDGLDSRFELEEEPTSAQEDFDAMSDEERQYMRELGIEQDILDAVRQLDDLQAEAARMREQYASVREQMSDATATGATPDGAIEVDVRYGVGVTEIRIEDSALRHGLTRAGEQVLVAVNAANAALARELGGQAQAYTGSRLNVEGLVESYQPKDDGEGG